MWCAHACVCVCVCVLSVLMQAACELECCCLCWLPQVVNLAHLASLIRNSTERFTKLELEWNKVSDVAAGGGGGSGLCS